MSDDTTTTEPEDTEKPKAIDLVVHNLKINITKGWTHGKARA